MLFLRRRCNLVARIFSFPPAEESAFLISWSTVFDDLLFLSFSLRLIIFGSECQADLFFGKIFFLIFFCFEWLENFIFPMYLQLSYKVFSTRLLQFHQKFSILNCLVEDVFRCVSVAEVRTAWEFR